MTEQLKAGETTEVSAEVAEFLDHISGLADKIVPAGMSAGIWINGCYYERDANGNWRATRCYA